jgi:hypothetical protein
LNTRVRLRAKTGVWSPFDARHKKRIDASVAACQNRRVSSPHLRLLAAWQELAVSLIVLAFGAVTFGAVANAQTVTATTGAVNGMVIDSTKAGMPGVTVTLSGASLMTTRSTLTDTNGGYYFSAVPTGDHTLTFQLAGFSTTVRSGIEVGLGFTATVNVMMSPGAVSDRVIVSGAAPVVDASSFGVTTRFDARQLATLPGARDFFAILSNTPGVAMTRMDVGGNLALNLQDYTAYGLRATTGVHRNEIEGIRIGGATGASDNYFSDFASFAEISIKSIGHTASMPVPGTLGQYVSKSGGNTYQGSLYGDYQGEAFESTNIDQDQLARGVAGGPGLDSRDVNRLKRFRDFTVDTGGYVKKDKAWWYGAYRSTVVEQRYPWLLDDASRISATVGSAKATYLLTPRQKLVGYVQYQLAEQTSFFVVGTNQPFQTSDALPTLYYPVSVWKGEYTAAPTDAVYVEARAGSYWSRGSAAFKSAAPRIVDVGLNTASGGASSFNRLIDRPQVNGSVSLLKAGWAGSHTFRIGGEHQGDWVDAPFVGYGHACNCVSTLNNRVPAQVQVFLGANVAKSGVRTSGGYVDDTWRLNRAITVSLGMRLDRYQLILPQQEGPARQTFAPIDPVLTFNNWGPRVGISTDLTGDGKTLLKVHYGRFWIYPAPIFVAAFNPNASGWSRTYQWTSDANGNSRWDPGEEGAVTSVVGGAAVTQLDRAIGNSYVTQASAYLDREVMPDFGVRTGVVINTKRQSQGTTDISRPLGAYSVPVQISDPGPDGRFGNADDGAVLTSYQLDQQSLSASPVNLTTNLPHSDSEYYTWELTATRRPDAVWSLLASITHTWSREAALGPGNDFTPNALVNATGYQNRFRTWQAKVTGTINLPLDILLVPVVRHQSGTPYARTFVQALNYGNAVIKAQPVATNRTPNITLLDLRMQKTFRVSRVGVTGLFDIYNLFNSNAEQLLTTSSGAAWRRPTVITGPRVARIGARLEWS